MKKIIVFIQLLFVASMTTAQQHSTDAVIAWPFYPLPVPVRNPFSSSNNLLHGPPINQRDDYTYVAGIGSYKLHTRAATWNEARIICEEEGGHLAIMNSIAEATAVSRLFDNSDRIIGSYALVGFHDLYQEGQFVTIHGESLAKAGYTRFKPGQPDNKNGNENCGSIYKTGDLNDIGCEDKAGFICEIPIY